MADDDVSLIAPSLKRKKAESSSDRRTSAAEQQQPVSTFPLYETAFVTTHKDPVICCSYSADGEQVATGSEDHAIKLVDVAKIIASYDDRPSLHQMDEQDADASVVPMRPIIKAYHDHTAAVNDLSFHPLRPLLCSASSDCTMRFFEYRQHSARRAVQFIAESHPVRSVAYHPGGQWLLVGTDHRFLRFYDTETLVCHRQGNQVERHKDMHTDVITCARWSTSGSLYASASADGSVKLWDGQRNTLIQSLESPHSGKPVTSLAFNADSTQLLTTGLDSTSQLYDVRNLTAPPLFALQYAHTMSGARHERKPMRASFDAQQRHVISASETTNELIIFDTSLGEIVAKIGGHSKPVRAVAALNYNSREFFTSGSDDARARFWVEKK